MAPAQLPSTMKAAVCLEVKGKTEVRDLKMPVPAAGEVLIKNISAGICHTDLHAMDGHIGFPIPAVFGHEVVIFLNSRSRINHCTIGLALLDWPMTKWF